MKLWPFIKPDPQPLPHVIPRYHAATKAENKLAHRKAVDRQLELAVAICHLTPEQRTQAKARASIRERKG